MLLPLFVFLLAVLKHSRASDPSNPELQASLQKYQDASTCLPDYKDWSLVYRNFDEDPFLGGTARCVKFDEVEPYENSTTAILITENGNETIRLNVALDSSLGYTTKNVINITPAEGNVTAEIHVIYRDCHTCLVLRHPYARDGYGCSYWRPTSTMQLPADCCEFIYDIMCGTAPKYQMYNESCGPSQNIPFSWNPFSWWHLFAPPFFTKLTSPQDFKVPGASMMSNLWTQIIPSGPFTPDNSKPLNPWSQMIPWGPLGQQAPKPFSPWTMLSQWLPSFGGFFNPLTSSQFPSMAKPLIPANPLKTSPFTFGAPWLSLPPHGNSWWNPLTWTRPPYVPKPPMPPNPFLTMPSPFGWWLPIPAPPPMGLWNPLMWFAPPMPLVL